MDSQKRFNPIELLICSGFWFCSARLQPSQISGELDCRETVRCVSRTMPS